MNAKTLTRLAGVAVAVLAAGPAWATETPFSNIFSHKGEGSNFIVGGETTRTGGLMGAAGQTCPFSLALNNLPPLQASAVPVRTFVTWGWQLDGAPPPIDFISINGNVIAGGICGIGDPDLCWFKDRTVTYLWQTAGLPPFIVPGGVNTIDMACDRQVGQDLNALGEGVSIVVVYDDPGQACRTVDVYCGLVSTETGATTFTATETLAFTDTYRGGDLHFFVNALDGSVSSDQFFINGFNVGGIVAGTAGPADAWQGALWGGGTPFDNLYDHADDDISPFMSVPSTSVTFTTTRGSDCIGHSIAAVSFPFIENCSGDSNGDGAVDVLDLLDLLAAWGPCPPPCPEDTDCSGTVDTVDLLALLAQWGPCPQKNGVEVSCNLLFYGPICCPEFSWTVTNNTALPVTEFWLDLEAGATGGIPCYGVGLAGWNATFCYGPDLAPTSNRAVVHFTGGTIAPGGNATGSAAISVNGATDTTVNNAGSIPFTVPAFGVHCHATDVPPANPPDCAIGAFGPHVDADGNGVPDQSWSAGGDWLAQPQNDLCANAIPICSGQTPFTNINAQSTGPSQPCPMFAIGNDIFYTYTASFTGMVTIDTCNPATNFDTIMTVYNTCMCPAMTPNVLACNDDFCGVQSQVTFPVGAGNCYLIQLGGFQGAQGTGVITITP